MLLLRIAHIISRIILMELFTLFGNLHSCPLCIPGLAASSVNESPNGVNIVVYVYWYNQTDQYVYRSDGDTVEQYVYWESASVVVGMVAHRTKADGEDLKATMCFSFE